MLAIDNILVARDFSSVSDRALRHALVLAAHTGAALHLLHADVLHTADSDHPAPTDGIDALRDELAEAGVASAEALRAVDIDGVVRRDVAAGPAILNYAAHADVDLLVLGTHGRRGARRMLLGSVAEEVVRRAEQPVLTVRGEIEDAAHTVVPGQIDRLLVPVDFSEHSREALRTAREWAALYDAHIDVLYAVADDVHPIFYTGGATSIYDMHPDFDDKLREQLDTFVSETGAATDDLHTHVVSGPASSTIAEFVDEHEIDLVALSTHGRTGLKRFLLGSVAEKVVRHVRCPVLTVKAFGDSLLSESSEASAAATA